MRKKDGKGSGGSDDYEVGYRRPPLGTRFKTGQSGNPAGRRKKKKRPSLPDVKASLANALAETVEVKENGRTKKVTKMDLLIIQLVNKAAGGNVGQMRVLLPFLVKLSETAGVDANLSEGGSGDLQKEFDALLMAIGVEEQTCAEGETGLNEATGDVEPSPDGMENADK